jgi:hypothetical protein
VPDPAQTGQRIVFACCTDRDMARDNENPLWKAVFRLTEGIFVAAR